MGTKCRLYSRLFLESRPAGAGQVSGNFLNSRVSFDDRDWGCFCISWTRVCYRRLVQVVLNEIRLFFSFSLSLFFCVQYPSPLPYKRNIWRMISITWQLYTPQQKPIIPAVIPGPYAEKRRLFLPFENMCCGVWKLIRSITWDSLWLPGVLCRVRCSYFPS